MTPNAGFTAEIVAGSGKPPGWTRLGARLGMGPFLVINERYRELLASLGLTTPSAFLALPEEIVSGHPDRQVSRVLLGSGASSIRAYLKREHHVPWQQRVVNAWDGFGLASKSWRETQVLCQLGKTSVGHPDWIACGADEQGRAFLLLAALSATVDLRQLLEQGHPESPSWDRKLSRQIGVALAQLHQAGFVHRDLYPHHVLLDPATGKVILLDWQRAVRLANQTDRWRDLASLHATLPTELASVRQRFACLRVYLRASFPQDKRRVSLREAARSIHRIALTLKRRRHIQAKRNATRATTLDQRLWVVAAGTVWLTHRARQLWPATLPAWMTTAQARAALERVPLPNGDQARLESASRQQSWWERCVRSRQPWTSPERRLLAIHFRLQRLGIVTPEILAVGEIPVGEGRWSTFLLWREWSTVTPLSCWLKALNHSATERTAVLKEAEALVERLSLHGFTLSNPLEALGVESKPGSLSAVVVRDLAQVQRRARGWGRGIRWVQSLLSRIHQQKYFRRPNALALGSVLGRSEAKVVAEMHSAGVPMQRSPSRVATS